MFKNLVIFKVSMPKGWASAEALCRSLDGRPFVACTPSQEHSRGWVPPRGIQNGSLLEVVSKGWFLALQIEKKVLPASVVNAELTKVLRKLEEERGRAPGKRERSELKQQVRETLLLKAFSKAERVQAMLDPEAGLLVVDASSLRKAEEVAAELACTVEGLVIDQWRHVQSPSAVMTQWLQDTEASLPFALDDTCELEMPDERRAAAKFSRHDLDQAAVLEHISQGKVVTSLGLVHANQVSFKLTEDTLLKSFKMVEVKKIVGEDAFDAECALLHGAVSPLLADLTSALGGLEPAAA